MLFTATAAPEAAIPSAVALVVACGASAKLVRPWVGGRSGERGLFRLFAPLLHALREHQKELRFALASSAALFALYALALGILAMFGAVGGSFENAHAVVTGAWGLAASRLLYAGLRRDSTSLQAAALGWLGCDDVQGAGVRRHAARHGAAFRGPFSP